MKKVYYRTKGYEAGTLSCFDLKRVESTLLTGKEILFKDAELVSREIEQDGKPMRLSYAIEAKILKPRKWRVVGVGSNLFIEWYEKKDCNTLYKTRLEYFHVVKEA